MDDITIEENFELRTKELERSVRKNHSYLVQYSYGMSGNWHDAENVVSNLWLYAIVHLDDEHLGCLPILRRKVYFLTIDLFRSRKGKEIFSEDVEIHHSEAQPYELLTEEEEAHFEAEFWSDLAIDKLTEKQKQAVWMSIRFELTYAEIAEKLGVSISTVGDYVVKGKAEIRKAMES